MALAEWQPAIKRVLKHFIEGKHSQVAKRFTKIKTCKAVLKAPRLFPQPQQWGKEYGTTFYTIKESLNYEREKQQG
jgi:hypothetical protein